MPIEVATMCDWQKLDLFYFDTPPTTQGHPFNLDIWEIRGYKNNKN